MRLSGECLYAGRSPDDLGATQMHGRAMTRTRESARKLGCAVVRLEKWQHWFGLSHIYFITNKASLCTYFELS